MATLKEEAQAYEPPHTANIADLDKIPIGIEVFKDGKGKDKDGKDFTYMYAKMGTVEYRVAGSVLGGIKSLLEKRPACEFVQVLKNGQGMNTRYQVIPYAEDVRPTSEAVQ